MRDGEWEGGDGGSRRCATASGGGGGFGNEMSKGGRKRRGGRQGQLVRVAQPRRRGVLFTRVSKLQQSNISKVVS